MKGLIIGSGLIPVIILIAIGIAIKYKKAYWLISGYNSMSEEKKKNVDIEGLGKLTANICFIIAFLIAVMFAFILLDMAIFSLPVAACMVPVIIYALVKAQKFNGNAKTKDGKMKTSAKVTIGAVISVFVVTAVIITFMLMSSSKPAKFALENDVLTISGGFGQSINMSEVTSVDICNTLPKIMYKTNGSSVGSMYKGEFNLRDIGSAKLYLDAGKSPFIYIKYTDKTLNMVKTVIINCEEGLKTQDLYVKLKKEYRKFHKD